MTRLNLAVTLAAALSLFTAGQARAIGGFDNPIQEADACGPLFVAESMTAPSPAPFLGTLTSDCLKLCKKSTSQCRSFTKKSSACSAAVQAGQTDSHVEDCKLFHVGAEQKACLTTTRADGKAQQQSIKDTLAFALADCDTWGSLCQSACP